MSCFRNRDLIVYFIDFLRFVERQVNELETLLPIPEPGLEDAGYHQPGVDACQKSLVERIGSYLGAIAKEVPYLSADAVSEFRFTLAAWADEVMVRRLGSRLPLGNRGGIEQTVFGTAHAGETLFSNITQVARRRNADDFALAAVYLVVLSFGFEGQYLFSAKRDMIEGYRKLLMPVAVQDNHAAEPIELFTEHDAAERPHAAKAWRTLLQPRMLCVATLMTWVAVLCVSELVWHWDTRALARQVNELHIVTER